MPDEVVYSLDYETFSRADLTKVGSSRYARDGSTEVLMCSWSPSLDVPPRQWSAFEGDPMPAELEDILSDERVRKSAWTSTFEKNITRHVLGIETPDSAWIDPMIVAMTLALPGSLDQCGPVVRLPPEFQKDKQGKALIRKWSMPRKPTKANANTRLYPGDDYMSWLDYLYYNRQDVRAEQAIWRRIKRWDLSPFERELWLLDQRINGEGMPVNLDMIRNAQELRHDIVSVKLERMKALTELANPNSAQQLLPWLQERGYPFDDLKKGHVERALERAEREDKEGLVGDNFRAEHDAYVEVLGLRQETSKSSVKKYDAFERATDADGRLRYGLQFSGAGRTNRWAGRLVQVQNLPRPDRATEKMLVPLAHHVEKLDARSFQMVYDKPMDALASAIRSTIQAPPGYVFLDADLSAIENIVLGWMSDERKILSVFAEKRDPYIDFASYLYNTPYAVLWDEYKNKGVKDKRQISKPGTLGCGYMLSAGQIFENEDTGELEGTGLLGYAWNMGVKNFTLEDSKHSVATWRATFKRAKEFWYEIGGAMRRCIESGRDTEAGPIRFRMESPFCKMVLPSGRELSYMRPRIRMAAWDDGSPKPEIVYEGINDKKQWGLISTHPGKVTENADQAIARDILAHGMMNAHRRGLNIRLHIHDQIVCLAPEDKAEEQLAILKECMTEPPSWAKDIPLNVGGFTSAILIKD